MNDHHHHRESVIDVRAELDNLAGEVRAMNAALARNFVNGEIASLVFDGKAGITQVTDDQGGDALSYALYNDTDVAISIGLVGGRLRVPKRKLLVAPVTVNGHVELFADPTALAETRISVMRWRFPTPLPFFLGTIE